MPDFQDVFSDLSFEDAKIQVSGDKQDVGNTGTPTPDTTGQQSASPADKGQIQTPDQKSDGKSGDQSTGEQGKPLPFDQDPKWKKARAAEAALEKVLKEHGILDVEELNERLAKANDLKKTLGKRDPKQILEDADYAQRVRQEWDKQKRDKQTQDETPDARLARLEKENEELRKTHETFKSEVEEREHAQRVLTNFKSEINRVLDVQETPVTDVERELLLNYLGIDNPADLIDIEDQTAVRKMAVSGIAKFRSLVKQIQQAAINEYAAGKSNMAVDTNKQGASANVSQGVQKQGPPKDATVDDVFTFAREEFVELLNKGMGAP